MTKKIEGIIPAMVTPLNNDEDLDEGRLRKLINFLIPFGIHGLFLVGSQGEFYAFSPEEKKRIWEVTVDEVNGRVPIYAGTGAITTRQVIELNTIAEDSGVDAVIVISPCFIKPSQAELYYHFSSISEASNLPVILYNNPARTGVSLSPDLVARLAQHPNIVAIKDSSGDLAVTTEIIEKTDDNFSVLVGRDNLIYAGLHHGIHGAVSATANVVPTLVTEIYKAFQAGDYNRSLEAQTKVDILRRAFNLGSFPVVVKDAMTLIGIPVGPTRKPIKSLDEEAKNQLISILRIIGALQHQDKHFS